MKKLVSIAFFSLSLMTSCSMPKDKSDSNAEKLVGCWYFPDEDKYFEFEDNGVVRFYQRGDLMMGEYSLSGDTLKCRGGEIGEGTLVIKSITDNDMELYFNDAEDADDYRKLKRISNEDFDDIINRK